MNINIKIIDGKKIAEKLLNELKAKISKLGDKKPTLAVILVGQNPASKIYVKSKKKACAQVGIKSIDLLLKDTLTEKELLTNMSKMANYCHYPEYMYLQK